MKSFYYFAAAILLPAIWLTGCASPRTSGVARPSIRQAAARPIEQSKINLPAAISTAPVSLEGAGWKSLFDGKTLAGWNITDFAGHGRVECESNVIIIDMGGSLTGINWTNEVPRMNYEIALDAMKLEGSDFFCGLTFPVAETNCSLILGGWGGTAVGLSSIDGQDASENDTTQYIKFDTGRWYRVRVRVTDKKIEVWLDKEKIIDQVTEGKKVGLRFGEIDMSTPLGICAFQTRAAVREIKAKRLEP